MCRRLLDGNGGNIATTLTVDGGGASEYRRDVGMSTVTIVPGNQSTQTGPIELGASPGG